MVCQSSYPLNSENASPPATCTVYLSCAEMAAPLKTASTLATAAAEVAMTLRAIGSDGVLDMVIFLILSLDGYAADQPKVNAKASTPEPRNSISNWRPLMGFGCRTSW